MLNNDIREKIVLDVLAHKYSKKGQDFLDRLSEITREVQAQAFASHGFDVNKIPLKAFSRTGDCYISNSSGYKLKVVFCHLHPSSDRVFEFNRRDADRHYPKLPYVHLPEDISRNDTNFVVTDALWDKFAALHEEMTQACKDIDADYEILRDTLKKVKTAKKLLEVHPELESFVLKHTNIECTSLVLSRDVFNNRFNLPVSTDESAPQE